MSKSIYINVPAKDVTAARKFYTALGFDLNEAFSNEEVAVMTIEENIMLMLVGIEFFKHNTGREIADTTKVSEVSLAIQVANRAKVDAICEAATKAGALEVGDGFEDKEIGMYSRQVTDLDGHKLDFLSMGEAAK